MAERLQIWNAAISHIGDGTILGGLDDRNTVANEIRRVYASNRDAMLAEFPWRFAERVATLAPFATVPPDSQNAYLLPAGCLLVNRVAQDAAGYAFANGAWAWTGGDQEAPSVRWRLTGDTSRAGDDTVIIVTQQPAKYIWYVRRVENEAVWPQPFATAMEWRLAWAISYGITRDLPRREECWRQFLYWSGIAQSQDQRQVYEPPREAPWIRARTGDAGYGRLASDDYDVIREYPVA